MKLKSATITILFNRGGLEIQLEDRDASKRFAVIKLTPEQVCTSFSQLVYTPCEIELHDLDKVGKKMEHKVFEFPMPENALTSYDKKTAIKEVKRICPKGWTPDLHFSSRNSFFYKDERNLRKPYARTRIRRWVNND